MTSGAADRGTMPEVGTAPTFSPKAGTRRRSLRARLVEHGVTDRPVFVGGCPRSGTTLFGTMLHSHPALAIPPETRFVVEAFHRRGEFGDLSSVEARRAVGEWVVGTRSTRFRQLALDRKRVVDAVADAPPTIGSMSGAVLREFAVAHGKPRWGDKRPKYVEVLPLVFRLFPDAQFIHLVRDARGCTASLKELGWWGWGAPEALDRWRASVEAGIEARRLCSPDQYLELRYEDLVADPAGQLARVCEFLGVPESERMLEHSDGARLIRKGYHDRVAKPVDAAAVDKWRKILEPEELTLVEVKVGHLLDEFGYPRLTGLPDLPAELDRHYDDWHAKRDDTKPRSRRLAATGRLSYQRSVAARLTVAQRRLAFAPSLRKRR